MGTERVAPGTNGQVAAKTTPEQDGAVAWKGSGQSEGAREGRDAFKEKRTPDFGGFPRRP